MIGNDVIDRVQSRLESNWKRKGWLDKLFTASEQRDITQAADPELWVWLLWSMKEAAYKVYNRTTGLAAFMPLQLRCSNITFSEGKVTGTVCVKEEGYYTQSLVTTDFIHTISGPQNNLGQATVCLEHREKVTRRQSQKHYFFKDAAGMPYLAERASGRVHTVSYSHHGRFEAIAFFPKNSVL
jgi:phosphopantetheinyl transferase (holo-ACP synthase)